ncbi:MAG: SUMF1/EgtB/PvdO family nonheme iron enzyme [Prevotellaceae bacterium]|nr:SUMF1/EgtB/PvdO family nonheme iron enzyme [Prevotellaceae bacterium]
MKNNNQQLRPGTVLRGQQDSYTIEEVLGQGGFGITYRATMSVWLERPLGKMEIKTNVAIKEFFIEEFCERDAASGTRITVSNTAARDKVDYYRKRFTKEATNVSKLNHPNIVKAFEVFEANNTAYIAMEHIEGTSLSEYVQSRGSLPEREAVDLIRQVAAALAYTHNQKIMHLDLKPANMLRRPDGIIKVIDFGLSKQYDMEGKGSSSTAAGYSDGYSPLELSEKRGVKQFSPVSDIYSLGATLYFLLTAHTPPKAGDVLNDGLPAFPFGWSKQVKNCITQAMQPRKVDRPQSIERFIALLDGKVVVMNEETKVLPKEETKILVNEETRIFVNEETKAYHEPPRLPFEPKMVFVQGGTFTMGSSKWELKRGSDEVQHQVTLSSFYIGKYEVTQGQWKAVMGDNPSYFKKGDDYPVEYVSWNDIQTFLQKLNAATGKRYRLPTEAEWEYACRAGSTTPFNTGNNLTTSQANYDGNYPYNGNAEGTYLERTQPVGSYSPNAWGLYDMHGNVWEWCSDWYGSYSTSAQTNPTGPSSGSFRVLRGGSWLNDAEYCRSANRSAVDPGDRNYIIGFRVVASAPL